MKHKERAGLKWTTILPLKYYVSGFTEKNEPDKIVDKVLLKAWGILQ